MIQQILKRFSQTAIGLDPPVPKFSLNPFTQLLHHRAAMFLVILEPFLIASSLNIVMAQRLVRRICPHCKIPYEAPKDLEDGVLQTLGTLPKDSIPKEISLQTPLKLMQGQGCVRCENTGYKGRVSISEVLAITEEVKKIIVSGGDLIANIQKEFARQGMYLMKQDGIIKALQGETTLSEVLDATRA